MSGAAQVPFEVLEIRARGGYAVLCRARRTDDPLQRDIALKVLKSTVSAHPSVVPRTRDEARVLSRINHPSVVRVEELLTVRGRPVIVMEWVPGVSVREHLATAHQGLPTSVALEITRRTALALAEVYACHGPDGRPLRVIHRDINPSNLLVTVHGTLKVVDFGISRGDYHDREASTISTVLGTLNYMAPERLHRRVEEGPAVDIYALGVTLIEMLTGECPIVPRDPERHDREMPFILREVEAGGLPELHPLLTSMCHHDPALRPSATEVAERCALQVRADALTEALARWGEEQVRPVYRGRPRVAPRDHPAWRDVAFLEEPPPTGPRAQKDPAVVADRAVRRFLRQKGWANRPRELRRVLAVHPEWRPEPFLAILAQAVRPWWMFWTSPPAGRDLVAALTVLRFRRTPDAAAMAEQLRRDERPDVAAAAARLIEHYASDDLARG